jgi:hypothetical protein
VVADQEAGSGADDRVHDFGVLEAAPPGWDHRELGLELLVQSPDLGFPRIWDQRILHGAEPRQGDTEHDRLERGRQLPHDACALADT